MKKLLLIPMLMLGFSTIHAATLVTDNSFGLQTSTSSPLTSGIVRYGFFASGTNFAGDISSLQNAFFEVSNYTISGNTWNSPASNLTYTNSGNYTAGDGVTVRAYDGTALDNSNVTTDLAGEAIYAWVLNNSSFGSVTEHGIFSAPSFFTWTDAQAFGSTDSSFAFDLASTDGLIAHVGTASASPGTTQHSLAAVAAVPEPSRAMLGFFGLAAMLFRRRRA